MIRYRPLFEVAISHDYFLSRGATVFEAQRAAEQSALMASFPLGQILDVFPDEASCARLAGHRMIFRPSDTGFMVAVQLDGSAPDIRPAIPPAADFNLTFVLRVKDARFANYTELGAEGSGFVRFGNDSQNTVAGVNYLSRRVAAFDPARRYVAGDTRIQPAGPTFDLFLALRDTGPSAAPVAADWRRIPADTFDAAVSYQAGAIVLSANQIFRAQVNSPGTNLNNPADWQPAGLLGNQYVSTADNALQVTRLFNLDLGAAALPQATVRVFRANETTVASEQTFVAGQGVLGQVQIDLRTLAPGPYRLEVLDGGLVVVPGPGGPIYLAPAARMEGWFGVIDIGLGTAGFALLNGDGTLRAPRYALRFLNRSTRWRYIFPAAQTAGTGADVAPEAGSDRILVTAAPRPLTLFGAGSRLQADDAATPAVSEEVLLPAPEANRIRRQNAEWFSEIHVSNLTVGP
jgi:hypothetical protein